MLALIADYGSWRKNLGDVCRSASTPGGPPPVRVPCPGGPPIARRIPFPRRPFAPPVIQPARPVRAVYRKLPGGLWGLGYAAADIVQYCDIPGVGRTACPGQDLALMQCHRMVFDENARRAANLANCLQAAALNNTSPAPCQTQYGPVDPAASCASRGGVNTGPFSYVPPAPPAVPTPVDNLSVPVCPAWGCGSPPIRIAPPIAPAGSTGTATAGGIQPGPAPGVTTNPPATVTPGTTTPAPPANGGTAQPSGGIATFLTGSGVSIGGQSFPMWLVLAAAALGATAIASLGGGK